MINVIIISVCQSLIKCTETTVIYSFHFIGFYRGHEVKKLHLSVDRWMGAELSVGDEYALFVEVKKVDRNCLIGKIKKIKHLNSATW